MGLGALATGERLDQWYLARFGKGKRTRKVGIVALARKLFIARWRWATAGVLPTGAILRRAYRPDRGSHVRGVYGP